MSRVKETDILLVHCYFAVNRRLVWMQLILVIHMMV